MNTDFIKSKSSMNFSFTFIATIISAMGMFIANLILSKIFPVEWFGIFTISLIVVNTVAEFSDLGLNNTIMRFIPHYSASGEEDKKKEVFWFIWNIRFLLIWVLTIGGIIFAKEISSGLLNQPILSKYIAISSLGIGGVISLAFLSSYLQATKRFKKNAIIQAYKGVLRILVVFILLLFKVQNIIVYIVAISFIPWVLFLFNYKELRLEFVDKPKKISSEIKKEIWDYSSWLGLWSIIAIIGTRVDQVVIVNTLGLKEIAIYNIAFQFMVFYNMISSSLSTIITPAINSALTKESMIKIIKKSFLVIISIVVVLSVMVVPSSWVITLIYGNKYVGAQSVYIILSFGMIVSIISFPVSLIVQYYKKTYFFALGSFLNLMLTLIFNIILIPKLNIVGAAIAFIITNLAMMGYSLIIGYVLLKRAE